MLFLLFAFPAQGVAQAFAGSQVQDQEVVKMENLAFLMKGF